VELATQVPSSGEFRSLLQCKLRSFGASCNASSGASELLRSLHFFHATSFEPRRAPELAELQRVPELVAASSELRIGPELAIASFELRSLLLG